MIKYFYKICLLIAIIGIVAFIGQKNKENFENQIPLHIYQTWHTKKLPPKMHECVEKLKMDNPEFEHHLYDIEECHNFIKNNFDKRVLNAFNKLKPSAFKADLWRYCILYKKGGVYLDIKYQCEPGFKLIHLANDNFYAKELWNGNYLDNAIYNGFLISKPDNEKYKKIIDQICYHVEIKYYDKFISGQTGPYLFGRYFNKREMDSIKYTYYEDNNRGFVKNIDTGKNILSFYPEYRNDQKKNPSQKYWQDMVRDKDVYED
jgi:mannosyltransferase OCH1-like enzyme